MAALACGGAIVTGHDLGKISPQKTRVTALTHAADGHANPMCPAPERTPGAGPVVSGATTLMGLARTEGLWIAGAGSTGLTVDRVHAFELGRVLDARAIGIYSELGVTDRTTGLRGVDAQTADAGLAARAPMAAARLKRRGGRHWQTRTSQG